jgi:hypothetical protein
MPATSFYEHLHHLRDVYQPSHGMATHAPSFDLRGSEEVASPLNQKQTEHMLAQAVNSNKRAAQSKVVKMMVSSAGTTVANVGTTDSKKQAQNAG